MPVLDLNGPEAIAEFIASFLPGIAGTTESGYPPDECCCKLHPNPDICIHPFGPTWGALR